MDTSTPALQGAVRQFTKGLAQMLMPGRGIRVNAVAPGPIWCAVLERCSRTLLLLEWSLVSVEPPVSWLRSIERTYFGDETRRSDARGYHLQAKAPEFPSNLRVTTGNMPHVAAAAAAHAHPDAPSYFCMPHGGCPSSRRLWRGV